jgi:uracil-DNA glycosylase
LISDSDKKDRILAFAPKKLWQFDKKFVLERFDVFDNKHTNHCITVTYAPLEWVNQDARIVIVGITPGEDQARRAYEKTQSELLRGSDLSAALREAKSACSFGGEGGMRERLVAALNLVGIAELFQLPCCSKLFDASCSIAHFTSLLKFPVFSDDRGYDGKTPIHFKNNNRLLDYHRQFFVQEAALLKNAIFLPLGETVRDQLRDLAIEGKLDKRQILPWLMHPSKNNRNRYRYLLGEVSANESSGDTNVVNVDKMHRLLQERVEQLLKVSHWQDLPIQV